MQRLTALDGLEVRCRPSGAAPAIVLVHGAMDRSAAFLRVAREFPDRSVVIYDRRGYGRSAIDRGSPTPRFIDHVADLHRVILLAREMCGSSPIVVGHSLGGTITLAAVAQHPDAVSGVLVYECPLLWEPWWPSIDGADQSASVTPDEEAALGAAMAASFMQRVIGAEAWGRLPAPTRHRRMEEGRILRSELGSCRSITPPALDRLEVPVTVALGRASDPVRRRAALTVVEHLPNAEMVTVENAPHNLHTADPTRFAALVRRVIARTGPDRPPIP